MCESPLLYRAPSHGTIAARLCAGPSPYNDSRGTAESGHKVVRPL
jgi:hypothetical protein